MDINKKDAAVVVTDPQNDFLSEKGVTWQLVGESVKENKTIEHIERIFKAAKNNGFEIFISPHYYYPTDDSWKFGGTLENIMHKINMFHRSGALSLDGFSGSGADWLRAAEPSAIAVARASALAPIETRDSDVRLTTIPLLRLPAVSARLATSPSRDRLGAST